MSVVAANGGAGSVTVATQQECAWSATASPAWLTVDSSSAGQGSGSLTVKIAVNPDGVSRRGTVTVNDARLEIEQAAAACRFSISPHDQTIGAAAGTATVTVTGPNGCAWTAASSAPWMTITGGASGSGNGTVSYQFVANPGASRTAALTIAGEVFSVNQLAVGAPVPPGLPGSACTYSTTSPVTAMSAAGGSTSSAVTTSPACAWTATSAVSWITIISGATGTGNGTVSLAVLTNSGPARSGAVTIAGQTFTITQAASTCTFTINPLSRSFGAGSGSNNVSVSTSGSCGWTATSNAPWITGVTPGGTGNGSVSFAVAANAGAARTGTITVAGQTFTVNQSSGCSFTISPTNQTLPAAAGGGTVTITASDASCGWSASVESGSSWLSITSATSGSGSGSVGFSVSTNTGKQRTGRLVVAGRNFDVTQSDH